MSFWCTAGKQEALSGVEEFFVSQAFENVYNHVYMYIMLTPERQNQLCNLLLCHNPWGPFRSMWLGHGCLILSQQALDHVNVRAACSRAIRRGSNSPTKKAVFGAAATFQVKVS